MSHKLIIGLCGYAGAGKSTAAKLLSGKQKGVIVPFAAALKDMLEIIGVPKENLYGSQEQKKENLNILCGHTARYAAQTLGTEWGRETIGENLWVNAWLHKVSQVPLHKTIIVDDVRFKNEVAAIKSLGGFIFRVENAKVSAANSKGGCGTAHASEQPDNLHYDCLIANDGSVDDLDKELKRIKKSLFCVLLARKLSDDNYKNIC